MNRTCVIVSPYFPPSTFAGVHRARHLAKHLPAAGWNPVVLCVNEAYHEERLDPDLAALVPSATEVVKVPALSPRVCRPLGFGEVSLRAWWPLRRELYHLLSTRTVNAVLITGSPYYPMLLASEIKRRFGVPVVLDFQDPWVAKASAGLSALSKAGVSHRLALLLEPKVVRSADFITAVSNVQNGEMAHRYPWLDTSRMAAIPIGGDPDDYDPLPTKSVNARSAVRDTACINISYVGTIWPSVIETVRALFRSLSHLRDRQPQLYSQLRLQFVGTTANPNDMDGYRVLPIARGEGVADIVHEIPQRLPYLEALRIQAESDVILLLGSHEPHYTASKIYGALMSGRPYLSVFHQASEAQRLLLKARGGLAYGFVNDDTLAALVPSIADGLTRLAIGDAGVHPLRREVLRPYEAASIAVRYADIFDRLALTGGRV